MTTTGTPDAPATDLGFLLHKHPGRVRRFTVTGGAAHVFYPVAEPGECTAALLLETDPAVPGRGRGEALVDDRPYAAGSLLAVALSTVFGTAMTGRCRARPELAAGPVPLVVRIPSLACRGGAELAERLFAPLGWTVRAEAVPLDPAFPEWGESHYVDTTLTGELRLADALGHLYVLLPVCSGAKHYWVGPDEVDKLVRVAQGWLPAHPERELITRRYLAHRSAYVRSALERLAESDDALPEELDDALAPPRVTGPGEAEPALPLARQRQAAVLAALREEGARRVVDLGCGGGALLRELLDDRSFTEVLGVDVSAHALQVAARRLRLDQLSDRARERIALRQSALTYADPSLAGYDAAVLMEVIEHVDEPRLPALEHAVFGVARPGSVVVTTPNVEYNVRFDGLEPGRFRHADHRFEWTRAQFGEWAHRVGAAHGYAVRFVPVGAEDPEVGPPTQMAVLTSASTTGEAS